MQVLPIIVSVLGVISYTVAVYFAVAAYFRLRRSQEWLLLIKNAMDKMLLIVMADHVRSNFHDVNELKKDFSELVARERYEDADQLKKIIDKAEKNAAMSLRNFKELFGDDMCEIIITKAKHNGRREDHRPV